MRTYEVSIKQDEEGVWEAEVPALPGCAVWGHTREQTMETLRDCAEAYIQVKLDHGDPLPPGVDAHATELTPGAVSITI